MMESKASGIEAEKIDENLYSNIKTDLIGILIVDVG
jgi:hypothetical protein